MTVQKTLVTIEDLYEMADDGHRYELFDGELVEMAPASAEHGDVANTVAFLLTSHVRPRRLGRVLINDSGVILGRDPDTDACRFGDLRNRRRVAALTPLVARHRIGDGRAGA